jgi:hypothetical protein
VKPTVKEYPYFDYVIGPYKTKEEAMYDKKLMRTSVGRMMNPRSRAKYCRKRLASPKLFHPKSFRVIPLSKEKGVKGIVGCPKKYFSVKTGKCKVGTRMQSILYPVGYKCPKPGLELKNPHLTGSVEGQLKFIRRGLRLLGFSTTSIQKAISKLRTERDIYDMYREVEELVGEDIFWR